MPAYDLVCNEHDPPRRFVRMSAKPLKKLTPEQRAEFFLCPCGRVCERDPKPPTSTVKETLDNGAMRRKVERFKDAEKLYKDRARGGPK